MFINGLIIILKPVIVIIFNIWLIYGLFIICLTPVQGKTNVCTVLYYTADVKTVKFCSSLLIYVLLEEDSNVHRLILVILIVMSCE